MSDRPRFKAGDSGSVDGLQWRVGQGRKSADDLVIEFRAPEWVRIKMAVGFLTTDFLYQNEDVLYPNGEGGGMYMRYLRIAVKNGWQWASNLVETDRRLKRLQQKPLFEDEAA